MRENFAETQRVTNEKEELVKRCLAVQIKTLNQMLVRPEHPSIHMMKMEAEDMRTNQGFGCDTFWAKMTSTYSVIPCAV